MVPEYQVGENWTLYNDRLDQLFIANFVEERKFIVLIMVIGATTYAILRELCDRVLPNTLQYEELCTLLSKQFATKVAVYRERTKFYELKQNANEAISSWYVRVKNGAINCKFAITLMEVLKDKFITELN